MAGNTRWEEDGRINQKRRMRAAVLEAAKRLLREGQTPSVAEVADAARVSRDTAYRYFPTQEYLLSEAAPDSAEADIDQLLAGAQPSDDPAARLDTLVRALQQVTLEQEAAFRTLLRLSLEAHAVRGQKPASAGSRRRWHLWVAPSRRTRPSSDGFRPHSRCVWALRRSLYFRMCVASRQPKPSKCRAGRLTPC